VFDWLRLIALSIEFLLVEDVGVVWVGFWAVFGVFVVCFSVVCLVFLVFLLFYIWLL
jgi:hypothetical protein